MVGMFYSIQCFLFFFFLILADHKWFNVKNTTKNIFKEASVIRMVHIPICNGNTTQSLLKRQT